jgi:hypothetical protein
MTKKARKYSISFQKLQGVFGWWNEADLSRQLAAPEYCPNNPSWGFDKLLRNLPIEFFLADF